MYGELEENKPAKRTAPKDEDSSDEKPARKRKSRKKEPSTSEESGETLGSEDSFTSDDI